MKYIGVYQDDEPAEYDVGIPVSENKALRKQIEAIPIPIGPKKPTIAIRGRSQDLVPSAFVKLARSRSRSGYLLKTMSLLPMVDAGRRTT